MPDLIALTKQLMAIPSVTPNDGDCQAILEEHLQAMGFTVEHFPYNGVSNFWARLGDQAPLFVFAGHTDVVEAGPLKQWHSPPFTPTLRENYLYGRGAADMKSAVAAMIIATEQFLKNNPSPNGSIGFLITSGEEGPSYDGTPKVVEALTARQEHIDYCLVGEPTSHKQMGDCIKIGRRGSLTGKLTINGKQGHIAYPHLADNPIHKLAALVDLTNKHWDAGNDDFQATSFQVSNINAGTGAGNVIPGHVVVLFNLRFSPESTADQMKQQIHVILDQHQLYIQSYC